MEWERGKGHKWCVGEDDFAVDGTRRPTRVEFCRPLVEMDATIGLPSGTRFLTCKYGEVKVPE